MCGILGTSLFIENEKFSRALDLMTHRGPDGYGIENINNEITLGHRRLKIIDLSENAKQPLRYEHLTITFNGEIYNYIELREMLKKKGHSFNSESDTEVILASYLEWGELCVEKFNGMWAFGIWDHQKKELFLSRDRFGKKPLFYNLENNKLTFASEMKSILAITKKVELSEDYEWCKRNLLLYESTDKTLFKGIKRFPAGSNGTFSNGVLKINKYWDTLNHLSFLEEDYGQQCEKFEKLFLNSCNLRMRSDVPLGASLSGGLDSSSIVSVVSYIQNKNKEINKIKPFIASFPGTILEESRYAKIVCEKYSLDYTLLEIKPPEDINTLTEYQFLVEDLYFTSPVPMIGIYKLMKKSGISVSLDGHGADELLAGYGSEMFEAFLDSNSIPQIKNIITTYNNILPPTFEDKKIDLEYALKYIKKRTTSYPSLIKHILNQIGPFKKTTKKPIEEHFNQILYTLFNKSVLPTLLRNYDRYSMAASVEVRMPFMDHELVNYCFSLPWQSKLNNGRTKAILRDSLTKYLPDEIKNRTSKIGFNTPFYDWVKNEWKNDLADLIHSVSFKHCPLVNYEKTHQSFKKIINSKLPDYDEAGELWKEINPYFFHQSFFNNKELN